MRASANLTAASDRSRGTLPNSSSLRLSYVSDAYSVRQWTTLVDYRSPGRGLIFVVTHRRIVRLTNVDKSEG
jgi:hypothetical protein